MTNRVLVAVLFLSLAVLSRSEAKKTKVPLQFVQLEYAKAISEKHKTNATVLHVRATGGKGKVSYRIVEPDTPFRIDQRGRIWLIKKLDAAKQQMCVITVKATAAKDNAVAYTKVRFDIMSSKNHAPAFDNKDLKYICAVSENSRQVQVLPPIKIIDNDVGKNGQLKRIEIVEDSIPFKFDVNKNGGVEVKATRDIDAEKETIYVFTILAVDGGEMKSKPASVFCKVVDVNEFAPEFDSDVYVGEVERGLVYDTIIQVHATDKDVSEEFGKVCEYTIETKNVPFNINKLTGVIRLDKPLDDKAPQHCTFQVSARDCSSKTSLYSNVTIYIKDSCKIELKKPDFEEIIIPQCIGKAILAPDVGIIPSKQCERTTDLSFSAIIQLQTSSGLMCDRQKYEASGMYKLCGSNDVIDILPKPTKGKQWTSKVKQDGEGFIFDGKTTVAVPEEVIPGDFGEQFTVSTWIQTRHDKGKQVIMANTDKQQHNRIHFALIKNKNRLTVIHRLEPIRGGEDDYCNSDFHYKPEIFDNKWHHLTVVVDRCSVKLYVDGQHQVMSYVDSNYRMHKSKISAGLFVGAHWLGREKTFTQFFKGKLAGMGIRVKKITAEQTIRCIVGCREHINIDVPLPKGFRSELIGFNKMRVHGNGSPKEFETILRNVEYQNELFTPTEGKRKVRITVSEEKSKLSADYAIVIRMEKNRKPVITVQGCKDERVKPKRLRDLGVPLCSTLKIDYAGCKPRMNSPVNTVELLDKAVVRVSPPFKKGESITFPKQPGSDKSLLDDLDLKAYHDKDGVVISGVANYKTYEQLLREMVYVNVNPEKDLHHTFTIYVSDQNGRFMSDKEKMSLSLMSDKKHFNRAHKAIKLHPFNFDAVKESLSAEELPGAVSVSKVAAKSTISSGVLAAIIICSVSVFAFLIVIGLYRLKKRAMTLEVQAEKDKEPEMYWDDTGLGGVRVTVNPLQKFQELDLNEDNENDDNSDDDDNQDAKQNLEWDEGPL